MRKIKIILLPVAGLVVLLIALIGIAVMILDNDDYQKILTAAVERYTGYRVIIEGDFDLKLSTEPFMSASNIRFEAVSDGPQPPITHIGHIYIKLAVQHLITGTIWIRQLIVEDVTYLLTVGRERQTNALGSQSEDSEHKPALPIFESVSLRNIIVNLSDIDKGPLFQVKLNDFKVEDDPASDLRYAKGEGIIDIYDFEIDGRFGSLTRLLDNTKPHPIELNFKSQDTECTVSGQIDDLIEGEGVDLHVAGGVTELSNFLKLFQVDFPGLGRLKFATDISGNVEALRASDINVTISEGLQVDFEAKGSVTDLVNGKGVDVGITGSSTNNAFIRMLLPDILSDFSKFRIKGNLRDRQGDYVLEDIVAQISNDINESGPLYVKAQGRIGCIPIDGNPISGIDLILSAKAEQTQALATAFEITMPELGEVSIKSRLIYSDESKDKRISGFELFDHAFYIRARHWPE